MRPLFGAVPITFLSVALVGCGDLSQVADPSSPTTTPSLALGSAGSPHAGGNPRSVDILDKCDPTTFNAVVGPGTCTRSGGVTFSAFVAELGRYHNAEAWNFTPRRMDAQLHETIIAVNRGGEVHTFTRVAAFGGGIVPFLNQLAHTRDVVPECTALDAEDFVPPDGTYTEEINQTGKLLFMCCIHPWMKMTVNVR